MEKQRYELSVWENYIPDGVDYYDQRKKVIISSEDMETPLKAYDITLKENINGEKTLTFSILAKYRDEQTNELIDNKLFSYITNESCLKLRIGAPYEMAISDISTDLSVAEEYMSTEDNENKWLDFVVKDISVTSTNYVASVTAKELYVNELGKNGWSLVLDSEKENNTGTLKELTTSILDGTDWQYSSDSTNVVENETLPILQFSCAIDSTQITNLIDSTITVDVDSDKKKNCYIFYDDVEFIDGSWVLNDGEDNIQLLYIEEALSSISDSNREIIDDDFKYNFSIPRSSLQPVDKKISFAMTGYSGHKVKDSQLSLVEPVKNEIVKVYKDSDGNTVYGHTETKYISPTILSNFLANPQLFTSTTSWYHLMKDDSGNYSENDLESTALDFYPEISDAYDTYFEYLRLGFSDGDKYQVQIPSDTDSLSTIKDKEFVFRLKARWIKNNQKTGNINEIYDLSDNYTPRLKVSIVAKDKIQSTSSVYTDWTEITQDEGLKIAWTSNSTEKDINYVTRGYGATGDEQHIIPSSYTAISDNEQYYYGILKLNNYYDLTKYDIRLQLEYTDGERTKDTYQLCIEEIQLFDKILDADGNLIFINDVPETSIEEDWVFYRVDDDDNIIELPNDTSLYTPVYSSDSEGGKYESHRTISGKESNYFNIIQNLAELFSVWISFIVKHQKNGKILLVDGKPQKFVKFSRYSPNYEINNYGFKYGINLQNIQRQDNSDSFTSKLIVKYNTQDQAEDGICTIARAQSNPHGETEIYNFDYYISKGLLSQSQVIKDLYGLVSDDFRYYPRLKALNTSLLEQETQQIQSSYLITKLEASQSALQAEINGYKEEIASCEEERDSYAETNPKRDTLNEEIKKLQTEMAYKQDKLDSITQNLTNEYQRESEASSLVETLSDQKQALKKEFYTKYSRFIQEGTWTDSNYIDDELYYVDAVKVSGVNAYPKVSYTIKVADIENDPDFSQYKFKIGQKTYIEDPDFFGYEEVDYDSVLNIKTPIKKEVIISEISRTFDDLSKTTIIIQTYRNQYEELFSKIQSTSQTLQYNVGDYTRAAAAVQSDGTISVNYIEKTFAENTLQLASATNQSVVWDTGSGIEVRNENNPNEIVRIIAGGIWISDNGPDYLKKVLDGTGIYPNYLRAGQIRTDLINIVSGDQDTFVWDSTGITAYSANYDESQQEESVDRNKYVKFNQYGLYSSDNKEISSETFYVGKTVEDDHEKNSYQVDTLREFIVEYGTTFQTIKDNNPDIIGDMVESNVIYITEPISMVDFLEEYLGLGSYSENVEKFKQLNNDAIVEGKFHGVVIPDEESENNITFRVGEQIRFTDKDDINTELTNNLQLTIPGQSIEDYIARTDKTDYQKVKYIQDNASFSLTSAGLEINSGSYQEDTVQISARNGFEIFGKNADDSDIVFSEDFISSDYNKKYNPEGVMYSVGDKIPLVSLGRFYDTGNTEENRVYGLRLRDNSGKVTLSTDNTGKLWVKDKFYVGDSSNSAYVVGLNSALPSDAQKDSLRAIYQENDLISSMVLEEDELLQTFLDRVGNTVYDFNTLNDTEYTKDDTQSITLTQGSNYKYYNFSEYLVNIWGGSNDTYSNAKFTLFQNGVLCVQEGHFNGTGSFTGDIIANSGEFNGNITVGDSAGINGYNGYFWATNNNNIVFQVDANGYLSAENATISGNITVESGSLKDIQLGSNSGLSSNSEKPAIWINTSNLTDLTSSNFYITQSGVVYANSINLKGEIFSDQGNGNIYGISASTDNDFSFWLGRKDFATGTTINPFYVTKDGDVYAQNLTLGATLETENDVILNGKLQLGNIIIYGSGTGSSIYCGDSWYIDSEGNASFNNISARGSFGSVVFKQDNVSSVGGRLVISPSRTLTETIYRSGLDNYTNGKYYIDSIYSSTLLSSINKVKIEVPDGTSFNECEVIKDSDDKHYIILQNYILPLPVGTNIIPVDLETSYIELNASNGNSYLLMKTGTDGERVQLGDLSNLQSTDFGVNLGNGLYAENAYIIGKLYLPNAGITNEVNSDKADSSVRIWAGSTAADKETAPFRVLQDGSLYASMGTFEGKIVAGEGSTLSGAIKTAGILLDDNENDHFYVACDGTDDNLDYLVDIGKDGLKIWEGGLNIYSDWSSNQVYNSQDTVNEDIFPYLSAIDYKTSTGVYSDPHLYTRALEVGEFTYSDTNNNMTISSIKISDGKIQFGDYTYKAQQGDYGDFLEVESSAYENTNQATICLQDQKLMFLLGTNQSGISIYKDDDIDVLDIQGKIALNKQINFYEIYEDEVKEIGKIIGYHNSESDINNGFDFVI